MIPVTKMTQDVGLVGNTYREYLKIYNNALRLIATQLYLSVRGIDMASASTMFPI
jgi:hypothetical protein